MNPKFVHLKTPQHSIAKSSYINLEDVGLIMTPKTRNEMKYRNYCGHITNDPTMLSLFTGISYDNLDHNILPRTGFVKDNSFYENAYKVCYTSVNENFFGFPNVSSLNYYFLMLYGLYRHHPSEEYKESLRREMGVLNEIFFVNDKKKGLVPLFTALDNGDATYTRLFDIYVKNLVENYADEFKLTAIQNADRYNRAIMEYRGNAHVVLNQCDFTHECETDFGDDLFHPRSSILISRHVRDFIKYSLADENYELPRILKDSGMCHTHDFRTTERIEQKDRSIFTTMVDNRTEYRVTVYPLQLESVMVLRKTREPLTLDSDLSKVYDMYHRQVAKMHPTGEWNASILTDVEEYKLYQEKINYLTRRLGIKATTKKPVSPSHSDSKFKLKVYYEPKSTKSLVKVIRWIAEQDKEAKITNRSGYKNTNYRADTGRDKETSIFRYCEEKSSELFEQNVKKRDNPYYCFIQESKNSYRSYYTVKHTKIFEYCVKGWMDDDYLISMIADVYLSTEKLTISMKCSDIKQLKKLKLLGIRFDNIEYDIADRKEVLEYFENY